MDRPGHRAGPAARGENPPAGRHRFFADRRVRPLESRRRGIDFIFGMDASPTLVKLAEAVWATRWEPLERDSPERAETRTKPVNLKEQIVFDREFVNQRLASEQVAEFDYQPGQCRQPYRVVVARKNITVEKGGDWLFDEFRYFFYITTLREASAAQIVREANGRCDQENVIAQLKGAVNAMRMPVDNLASNWVPQARDHDGAGVESQGVVRTPGRKRRTGGAPP
jgi:hypothetical protein